MKQNGLEPNTMALVRLVAMAISWLSLLLVSQFGWEPLPFDNEQIMQALTLGATVLTSLWGWFKNNPVTEYGKEKEETAVQNLGTRQEFNKNSKESED